MSKKTARQKQQEYINSLPDCAIVNENENSTENPQEKLASRQPDETKITEKTAQTMNFSKAVTNSAYEFKHVDVQQVLKMKIIPPLTKELFTDGAALETAMSIAYKDILSVFNPRYREMITISRTNMKLGEKKLQVLLVIAPIEAEEDVARIKLNGLKIMNRTVFPTAEDTWMVRTSAFPKVHDVRINNLPALCDDKQLMELLQVPDFAELGEIQRERQRTELGTFYTGKAKIAVKINNHEEQEQLENWSKARASSDIAYWCELPIYASIPALHECQKCKEEKRQRYRGHHEDWCRINRKPKPIEKPETDHPAEMEREEGKLRIVEDENSSTHTDSETSSDTEEDEQTEATNDTITTNMEPDEAANDWTKVTTRTTKRNRSEIGEESSTNSSNRKKQIKRAKKLQTQIEKLSKEVNGTTSLQTDG